MSTIKGFKGFDKNLKCRGYQYEIGKSYKESEAKACEAGFHFCEYPLDVFNYYQPSDSRYTEVEGSGKTDNHVDDSKVACTKIKIGAEIGIPGIISASVKYIHDHIDWNNDKESNVDDMSAATNTGDRSAATNTGDRSAATNTGDRSAATNSGDQSAATNSGDQSAATNTGYRSAATNTGDRSAATNSGDQSAATNTGYRSAATNTGYQSAATNSGDRSAATNSGDQSAATNTGDRSAATNTGYQSAASVEGKHSVACGLGIECKVKGALGCGIVLVEREWNNEEESYVIKNIKAAKVDGEKIKADTWYMLIDNEFVEKD
jgi:hypothetical protein